jgi:hypothetical protein
MEEKRIQDLFDILTQLTAVKDLSLKNYREVARNLTAIHTQLASTLDQLTAINKNLVVVNDIIDKSALGWLLTNITKAGQKKWSTILSIVKYSM